MDKSRTEYSAQNTTVAVVSRMVAILMGFATRVVFTHTLSEAYVGVNGLFTDILNVLALSELGVGTAITFALYRPIAQGDVERQKSLMLMYRTFYRIVAGIVLVCGLMVIPFMGLFVSNSSDIDHLILIYLLYLANSVISYLLIYKRTLIDAHQLIYVGTLYQTIFLIIQDVLQIIILLTTKNFILFLIIYILCTLGTNLSISRKADKLYPYLREKNIAPLPAEERKEIFKNIKAMLMHKIGNVVVNNTDNLLISAFVGVISVGKYSNYYLVIGSIRQVLDQIFTGITASVGNLGVTANRARVKKIFEASFFIGQWMYGVAAIALYSIINPFVSISFGSNYLFDTDIVLILCVNFYVTGMRKATLVFQDSLGLFWYNRYKAIAEAIINLGVSIALAVNFGIIGIFLGTFISTMTTSMWVEPYVLYKHHLKTSMVPYFIKYAIYTFILALTFLFTQKVCSLYEGGIILTIAYRVLVCAIVPNLILFIAYNQSWEFKFLVQKLRGLLGGRLARGQESAAEAKAEWGEGLDPQERYLLGLLRTSLEGESESDVATLEPSSDIDWEEFFYQAGQHSVTPLIYDQLCHRTDMHKMYHDQLNFVSRQAVQQSYRLLFLTKAVIEVLEEAGVKAVVLKGAGIAHYYPVPELRKSGDVDLLLLNPADAAKATEVLCTAGFGICEHQHANHHIALESKEGIEVELHTMLAEPFDSQQTNEYLESVAAGCGNDIEYIEVMGVSLPVPKKSEFAFHLLLHMLQHFLRAGFGLKLLCDWVVFWNQVSDEDVRSEYLELVQESGLKGFSDLITATCVKYLGLREEAVAFMVDDFELSQLDKNVTEFIHEIFSAEEFGRSSTDRMVIVRDSSLGAYIREFHHQMRLNHPRASRIILLWPILWVVTLVVFLVNNRRIRGISALQIFRTAHKRSRLVKDMRLFKKV